VATLSQHQQPLTARQPVRAMRAPGSNFPTQIRPVKFSVPGKVQEIPFFCPIPVNSVLKFKNSVF
jgi:hypothetical protein